MSMPPHFLDNRIRNLPGGKGQPTYKADNLTISQLYVPPKPIAGIDYD
jgi:hypothetical protein